MRHRRGHSAQQIENHVLEVAEAIFNVVAEDPQIQHVSAEVQPAAVEKHGNENADQVRRVKRRGPESRRHEGDEEEIALDVLAERQLPEEHEDIRRDEQVIDDGDGAPRIVIGERQHPARILDYRRKYRSSRSCACRNPSDGDFTSDSASR